MRLTWCVVSRLSRAVLSSNFLNSRRSDPFESVVLRPSQRRKRPRFAPSFPFDIGCLVAAAAEAAASVPLGAPSARADSAQPST